MIQIRNECMALYCHKNGCGLALLDVIRGTRWVLDEKTLVFRPDMKPLVPVEAKAEGGDRLVATYKAGEIPVHIIYVLKDGYVEIRLPVPETDETGLITLPGSFYPGGEKLKLILPIMQGMQWDGRGDAFKQVLREASHIGFSMPFIGYMGKSGDFVYSGNEGRCALVDGKGRIGQVLGIQCTGCIPG